MVIKHLVGFFCNEDDSNLGELHRVETLTLDERIRNLATDLQDNQLLTKLAAGDMAANDSVYHKKCLTSFYNRHRSFVRRNTQTSMLDEETLQNKATAFAELVTYIESFESDGGNENIFKLSDLNRMYINRLKELGTDASSNSSHLKDKLLSTISALSEHKSKYETVLSFRKHVGNNLLAAKQSNSENDRLILMRAASIVRKDIFRTNYQFRGSLLDDQYNDISEPLRFLVKLILSGNDISNETENARSTSDIVESLAQLLVFNTLRRKRKDTAYQRHTTERETMLPLYLGLLVHGKTRKRDLVDILHERGLCISYNRVLQISSDIANSVITQFEESGVVCPTFLKTNVFTTGNLDNIDHNTSSNTSKDSFHGTAISLTQHVTDRENISPVHLTLTS